MQRGDRITGTATGYDRYDRLTAGLHPGDLTIVAARPGHGQDELRPQRRDQRREPQEAAKLEGAR